MNWYKEIKADLLDDIKKYGPEGHNIIEEGLDPEEKKQFNKATFEDIKDMYRRNAFLKSIGMWAIPTKEAIQKIKGFVGSGKILEVGAGRGGWAKLLRDEGVNIVATDPQIWPENSQHYNPRANQHTEVEKLDHLDALDKYPNHDTLMLIWPSYADSYAHETLSFFNGNKVIYIGEGRGGCTADDAFHELLSKEYNLVEEICIPRWKAIYDNLTFWTKK